MTIRKNTHAPFMLPQFYLDHQPVRYKVSFTDSCRYGFGTKDDNDINKLFGVAFITWGSIWNTIKSIWQVIKKRSLKEFKSLHHYNSIRYGWRYDALSNRFEVWRYMYYRGERFMSYVDGLYIGESYKLGFVPINEILDEIEYSFYGTNGWVRMPANCLMYTLHPYFGGNNPAPHDMEIKINKL